MRLKNILIVVKDIEKSKQFYHDLFGLEMILVQRILSNRHIDLPDCFIFCVVVNRRSHRYDSFLRLEYETIIQRQCIRNLIFVVLDNDGNMILTEGLVLQDEKIWKGFLEKDIISENNSCELYFEERDIEAFVQKLEKLYPSIKYVNRLTTHSWGQKVIRFYDLYRWRLIIAICAEHGRFATSTYSCECASPGGAIYLAIFNHQIYRW